MYGTEINFIQINFCNCQMLPRHMYKIFTKTTITPLGAVYIEF